MGTSVGEADDGGGIGHDPLEVLGVAVGHHAVPPQRVAVLALEIEEGLNRLLAPLGRDVGEGPAVEGPVGALDDPGLGQVAVVGA